MDNWIMLALAACGATTIMRAICRLDTPDKKRPLSAGTRERRRTDTRPIH